MKTSSITLISLIGLALAAAFFFPVLSMRRVEVRDITITATGESVEVTTGLFVTLEIHNPASLGIRGEDFKEPLTVRISSGDSVTAPRVVMDRTWHDMAGLTLRHDTLSLSVKPPHAGSRDTVYYVAPEAARICDIIVPQGMLRTVNPPYNLFLHISDLRQPSLTVNTDGVNPVAMTGCVIEELRIE